MIAPGKPAVWTLAIALSANAGCSLILDFDKPEEHPVDAPVSAILCQAFEPNDDPGTATAITPGDYQAAICGGGETDYFKFTVNGSQNVLARITFDNRGGQGDIDLRLLSKTGASTIDESRTSNDTEEVDCPGGLFCNQPLAADDYLLQVLGFNAAVESEYTLHLEITP